MSEETWNENVSYELGVLGKVLIRKIVQLCIKFNDNYVTSGNEKEYERVKLNVQ